MSTRSKGARKGPRRASGTSKTNAERLATTGRLVVSVTLDADGRAALILLAERWECSRSEVVARLLASALP